jgi:peptidoglycan hydrolase-like protein with peptidoglycan-binding domain
VTAKKPKVLKGNSAKFGEIVSRVQVSLMTRGYNVGTLSGELDAKTTAALYKYQRENGLPPTGKLESSTLSRLGVVAQ